MNHHAMTLPASVLARIRDLLPPRATDDRYLTLPLVCRAWHAALVELDTLVFDGRRTQLARYINSLHAERPRARRLVLRNIDASWFTSSYGPDAIHASWLALLLVHHADELRVLVLEKVEPLTVDAVMDVVAQVGQLVHSSSASAGKDAKSSNSKLKGAKSPPSTAGLFPHLTSVSIVGLRNVDPRTLHSFLAALGAISTPTAPQTVTHLRLSNIDFALNHALLAAILPPPPPEKHASSSNAAPQPSTSAHADSLPSYSDSQLAHSTTLTSLTLSFNPDTITDATLTSVLAPSLAAMASLTHLSLANCIQVSSRGLAALTPYTPWLKHLDVSACPLMGADLRLLARALDAVSASIEALDMTLATTGTGGGSGGGGSGGSPVTDSPQWTEPTLDAALVRLGKLKHLAVAYTDDDALPCVCSGLQVALPTLLALIERGLPSLQITWQPGPNHHGGIPCGLVRRLITHAVDTGSRALQVTLVGKNALRSDRMVYYDRGSVVSGMFTVAAALRGCAEFKCLGEDRGGGGVGGERSEVRHKAEGDYLVDAGFVGELNREVSVAETGGGGAVRVRLVTFEMMKD